MPKKGGTITPQERHVIDVVTKPLTHAEIAAKTGYANSSGVSKALARPAVQAESIQRQMLRIETEVLPLAVQTHIDMLISDKTPAGAKAQLVKLAYDRALGSQEANAGKAPHEMTADEIAKALMALQSEASNRAKPIIEGESAPVAPNTFA
jgi:hypothetical protein